MGVLPRELNTVLSLSSKKTTEYLTAFRVVFMLCECNSASCQTESGAPLTEAINTTNIGIYCISYYLYYTDFMNEIEGLK